MVAGNNPLEALRRVPLGRSVRSGPARGSQSSANLPDNGCRTETVL